MIRFHEYLTEAAGKNLHLEHIEDEILNSGIHGGKTKSLIIKDYIDGMEKIMKKYARPLKSILTDYTKKRALIPDPDSGETAMWDELVVNNFKIKKIHVGPEYAPDFDPESDDPLGSDDIGGFPFELYDTPEDMVDYITRTVQRIKL